MDAEWCAATSDIPAAAIAIAANAPIDFMSCRMDSSRLFLPAISPEQL
jgi:hypothetical protein